VLASPPEIEATLSRSPRQGQLTWILSARVLPPVPLGYQERVVELATTGDGGVGEGRPYQVKVRWTGAPDVEIVPSRLLFARDPSAPQGELAEGDLWSHLPGQRLKVVRHAIVGEHAELLAARVEPVYPDDQGRSDRWRIVLEPRGPLGNVAIDAQLVIETDDVQFPTLQAGIWRRGG
jgi:hypothetical protein